MHKVDNIENGHGVLLCGLLGVLERNAALVACGNQMIRSHFAGFFQPMQGGRFGKLGVCLWNTPAAAATERILPDAIELDEVNPVDGTEDIAGRIIHPVTASVNGPIGNLILHAAVGHSGLPLPLHGRLTLSAQITGVVIGDFPPDSSGQTQILSLDEPPEELRGMEYFSGWRLRVFRILGPKGPQA
jgi:hypothetical protein